MSPTASCMLDSSPTTVRHARSLVVALHGSNDLHVVLHCNMSALLDMLHHSVRHATAARCMHGQPCGQMLAGHAPLLPEAVNCFIPWICLLIGIIFCIAIA